METLERTDAGPSETAQRPFQAKDLVDQVVLSSLAVAPDGSSIAYARRTVEDGKYVRRLWRTTFTGGEPDQLTNSRAEDRRPRYSPDGKSIVFISDRSGKPQAWLMSLTGGEPRQLTDLRNGIVSAEWSPEGTKLLLLASSGEPRFIVGKSDDPTARRIRDYTWRFDGAGIRDEFTSAWAMDVARATPTRLTAPQYEVSAACWSPDGKRIALVADLRPEAALEELPQAWTIDASNPDNPPQPLATLRGAVYNAAWAPSDHIALLGNNHDGAPDWANSTVHITDGTITRHLAADRDLYIGVATYGDFHQDPGYWPPPVLWLDQQHVASLVSIRGASHPYTFAIDGKVEALAEPDAVCWEIAAGGGHIAVIASSDTASEVHAVENGKLRRLTTDGSKWFGPFRRPTERITIPHQDGHTIDAWLIPARGARGRGPLVIDVHGGPYAAFGPTPWLEMVALADAGIHIIRANPHGSASYGESFARVVDGHWGDPDSTDILRVIDWAIEQQLADPKRLGIMGLSYGGFMTAWMLGAHPGIFAAAVSENPVTDMLGEYASSDAGRVIGRLAVGSEEPWEHADKFLERSPYMRIHLNHAPLLMLQAENDLRCPPGQTEMVFAILKGLGREVEMIRYPGESHVMFSNGRPDRRADRIERIVGWFQKHLAES